MSEPVVPDGIATPVVDIPYAFAREHGVVIAPDKGDSWLATLREGSDPAVLIEVKRYLAQLNAMLGHGRHSSNSNNTKRSDAGDADRSLFKIM